MEGTNNPGFVPDPRKRGLFDTQYSNEYNNDSNCNTYIESKKNLGDLTIEAMPLEENYRQRFSPNIGNIEKAMWVFNCLVRLGHCWHC